ncbi:solute carrier organic anion transporter family member 4A1-like isoform X2 [Gigantopelta aegis]|uniref:solute carrier organic anion transporter family member 4A1-like isoform X2 n=1 Tax=Gigantopelta aegis TaxID=1735272 RepID=UPI001B88DBDC|nr:solute carrier organic anion transporter family member 4A1-like isoform X2 [Gigantopelta aegis]
MRNVTMTNLKSRPIEYSAMEANTSPAMSGGKTAANSSGESVFTHVDREKGKEEACGWGPFTPRTCQRFRNPICVLFWLCWASAIQGVVVNGFVNVVISSIEKRFEISSTESGAIASCYDIAAVLSLIPVTYFGGLGLKPRYLGIGIFILGVGSFVFSLPHFTTDLYRVSHTSENLCLPGVNQTSLCDTNTPQSLSNYKYVFFLGQLLHGAGASPLYTLGVNYLDENLPPRSSSFYIGIFYALAIVGPAIGYVAGGEFLKMHTDIGATDTSNLSFGPTNPRWVGAWWIGFLITGFLAFFISVPLAGFPRSLPGASKYQSERGKEVYVKKGGNNEVEKVGNKKSFKDLLLSIKLLVINPTFMFLNLAAASEGILLSGFSTFGPKFVEAQFSLPSSSAAQYIGFAAIPAGGGGTFLGGYLVKRFNLKMRGIIRLCMIACAVAFLTIFVFLINCENVPFAGINVNYGDTSKTMAFLGGKLDDSCNAGCGCTEDEYLPVCGKDGTLYFSPCYAGCGTILKEPEQTYTNCSCINFVETNSTPFSAEFGKCESSCKWLPLFMPFFGITILFTFISSMPALSATLRCLPEQQRPVGLGIQWIIARCLGSIPGPILFGKMIDLTCELWQKRCDEQGSCFFYNNRQMSYNMLALGLVLKFLSFVFFLLALLFYRSSPQADHGNKDEGISMSRSTLNTQLAETPAMERQKDGNGIERKKDGEGTERHKNGEVPTGAETVPEVRVEPSKNSLSGGKKVTSADKVSPDGKNNNKVSPDVSNDLTNEVIS